MKIYLLTWFLVNIKDSREIVTNEYRLDEDWVKKNIIDVIIENDDNHTNLSYLDNKCILNSENGSPCWKVDAVRVEGYIDTKTNEYHPYGYFALEDNR